MQRQPDVSEPRADDEPRWWSARDLDNGAGPDGLLSVEVVDEDDFRELLGWLARVARLRIRFENFADGRGFSWARRLRQRYGYQGELVAAGDVLPDQAQFLEACGFDRVEPGRPLPEARAAVPRFTVAYRR